LPKLGLAADLVIASPSASETCSSMLEESSCEGATQGLNPSGVLMPIAAKAGNAPQIGELDFASTSQRNVRLLDYAVHPGTESSQTRRWRKTDSNSRSR
jgi:hypothetical protein